MATILGSALLIGLLAVSLLLQECTAMKLMDKQANARMRLLQRKALLADNALRNFHDHPCRRECQPGESLTCHYELIVHDDEALGEECRDCMNDPTMCDEEECHFADGVANPLMLVNNQYPAPAIEVCENDVIVADVLNLLDEPTTMHWHGMHMSETKDMDGAPYITQYPLEEGETQRYTFPVDRSGTIWYHSHSGWQRALGVAGALVIRQPKLMDSHGDLYDHDLIEHTLMIQDVLYNSQFNKPRNILINGKGRNHLNAWPDSDSRHNYEHLTVVQGQRYRMRFISNGVFNCPVEISIENHEMLVIATDGNDLEPISADTFYLTSAERLDIILEADQEVGNYWIKVKGHHDCANLQLYQGAVLHYSGARENDMPEGEINADATAKATEEVSPAQTLRQVNIITEARSTSSRAVYVDDVPTVDLQSLNPLPWSAGTEFTTYYKSFGLGRIAGSFQLQSDDITFVFPHKSLLQESEEQRNGEQQLCNREEFITDGIDCRQTVCKCTNVVKMPAYSPIELVVVNLMGSTHPFHLHGFTFRVVGQETLGDVEQLRNIQQLDESGLLERSPNSFPAPEKDTVQIPPLGYIIIRFISDNPGFWLYHCHIESHGLQGMAGVVHVVDEDDN